MAEQLVGWNRAPILLHVFGGVLVTREDGGAMVRVLRIACDATWRVQLENVFWRTVMEQELRDALEVA